MAWSAAGATGAGDRELNGDTAAFEVLKVEEFDGALGGFDGFEVDVAESVSIRHSISMCRDIEGEQGRKDGHEPFTQTSLIQNDLRINYGSRSLKLLL